jgi:DNA-directed RNA polymerase subunit RPC12/RpoP
MALGLFGVLSIPSQAEPSADLMNSVLQTREQAAKVTEGETVAMVCAKCKTVLLAKADEKKGFLGWFQSRTKHECPGCGGKFFMREVPSGQGGALSAAQFVHTCSKCGDESAFCCAVKPDGGSTRGMEEPKKSTSPSIK